LNTCTDVEVATGGPYSEAGTEYIAEECVPSIGEFKFTISDSYGDGMCCSYGEGGYKVSHNGISEGTGGDYGSQADHEFGSSCDSPVDPTPSPVDPTPSPVDPTPSPVDPTPSPVDPTPSPVDPTTSPVDATPSPVEPTPQAPTPVQDNATWGLDRSDQRDLPLNGEYGVSGDGSGVTAYIIDTGVLTTHEEFGNRASFGINTSGDGNNADCNGHGTHVAGTVGGTVYGVAKNVNIVAVKVLACSGSGSTAGVIEGINWVKNDAVGKKATANMSLGGGSSSAMNAAVKALHDSGVVTVVAAGNSNANACNFSPAGEVAVITVGSTTITDARSGFSNYGSCLDIFAPGSDITSAWIGGETVIKTISGTSMASPHVCGGVALLLGKGISAADAEIEILSRATNDKVTDPKTDSPNKLLYVGEVGPTNAPTPAPPTNAPTPCIGGNVVVEILTDNYPAETSWTLLNTCTDVEVATGGPYSEAGTEYIAEECVPSIGEFKFTISDSYGDGMCCSYGEGGYKVSHNGISEGTGGDYGSQADHEFGSSCDSPVDPTPSPVDPTPSPVDPTPSPVDPTPSPVDPTPSPVDPTTSPVDSGPAPVSSAPVEIPDESWVTIFNEGFENSGSGSVTFNNYDNRINTQFFHEGEQSVRLKKTQKVTSKMKSVRNHSDVKVDFFFYAKGMDDGEVFYMDVRFNGGAPWVEAEKWVEGEDFDNGEWLAASVTVSTNGKIKMKFRIRGGGNQGNDQIFIDDVTMSKKAPE